MKSEAVASADATHPAIVLGGSGYVADEFLRLIASHPNFTLGGCVSTSQAGEPIGKGHGFEPWELFVAGIIGSFVGGLILNLITGDGLEVTISGLIGSTIGAIVVLAVWGWLRSKGYLKRA